MNTMVSAYGPLVLNVFDPLSTYSSPSRRAVDFIDPKASEPEPGSVMAHAPTLSSVSRSSAQRSFWAMVPFEVMAASVRPVDTPSAVTRPGLCRHSSMMGIIVMDPSPPPDEGFSGGVSPLASASATSFSNSIWRLKRSAAIVSMPNVL